MWLILDIRPIYSVTGALVVALLVWQLEAMFADRRVQSVEAELADAIDLMVGTLRAGAGMIEALESAVRESHPPLNEQLDEVAGRIRFGDDPQTVFRSLTAAGTAGDIFALRLRPFGQLGGGGSLASTLATVGRTIRDRIEISRRIRAMTSQVRISIIADVDGHDTAQKLAILASLAFGTRIAQSAVYVEGISSITPEDLRAAAELGYRVKLLGVAVRTAEGIEQRVHPTMVPKSSSIAQVMGVTNAVTVDGKVFRDYAGRPRGGRSGNRISRRRRYRRCCARHPRLAVWKAGGAAA